MPFWRCLHVENALRKKAVPELMGNLVFSCSSAASPNRAPSHPPPAVVSWHLIAVVLSGAVSQISLLAQLSVSLASREPPAGTVKCYKTHLIHREVHFHLEKQSICGAAAFPVVTETCLQAPPHTSHV